MTQDSTPPARKRVQDMNQEELDHLRQHESVIGTVENCLIVGIFSGDTVLAKPMNPALFSKIKRESDAIIFQKFNSLK